MAQKLRKMGFKDVSILKGGLGAWTNAGLPIESRSDLSQVGVELYKALAGGVERVDRAGMRRGAGADWSLRPPRDFVPVSRGAVPTLIRCVVVARGGQGSEEPSPRPPPHSRPITTCAFCE